MAPILVPLFKSCLRKTFQPQCTLILSRKFGDRKEFRKINSSFSDGLFFMKHNDKELILSYYTPINSLLKCLIKDEDDRDDAKIFDHKNDHTIKKDTLLGAAFQKSEEIVIKMDDGKALAVKLDSSRSKISKWAASQKNFDNLSIKELEQQKKLLLESYTPLMTDFNKILQESHGSSSKKFKWLGLFLVSAPLGFVGRLTWFEYSWDIMEPFTWCITYAWTVVAFGYYVMTSQEYQYQQVEKRMAIKHFCESYSKKNFDLTSFTSLHKQLKQINAKIEELKVQESSTNRSE